jgi:sodium-dependent dicarboxylate transporter 2/3/5
MGCLMLPTLWWALVHWVFPISDDSVSDRGGVIAEQLASLGPMAKGERIVAGVVSIAAVLWVFRPWIDGLLPFVSLSDTTIALGCGVALFIIPVNWKRGEFALSGEWAKDLPWGVLLLFGGGLSLAAGIKLSGLADWIGASAGGLAGLPTYVVILGIVVVMIVLTEFASNTATTATFLPIAGAVALAIGENPLLLVFPAVLAASCAFMMPVATPPNAVVFGSGQLRIAQFMRAGIYGNLAGLLITMLMAFSVIRWVFGIEVGVLPGWASG